jgi:hypothetical protein
MFTLVVGCFPDRRATMIDKNNLRGITQSETPTKVFLADASVVLFPKGYTLRHDTLEGLGHRLLATSTVREVAAEQLPLKRMSIPIDSALALTYFQGVTTTGRALASVLLGVTGGVLTPTALYCLSNPKACFGSCPTVYTSDGENWNYEAELFSYSVSTLLESRDLDRIAQPVPSDGRLNVRIANEALESHFINLFRLVAVRHPQGTQVFPTTDGEVVAVRELHPPVSVQNSEGVDVLPHVGGWDDDPYRSDTAMVRQVETGRTSDWIDLRVRAPENARSVTMVLRLKNTLLSTVLFYGVVLGSQGIQAIEWTQRMNTDPLYASQFRAVYSAFSGIRIQALRHGSWDPVASIHDVGPVGWKSVAARIPLEGERDLTVRLEFFPDNIMIDYVGFAFQGDEAIPVSAAEVEPVGLYDRGGAARPDVLSLIKCDDGTYLETDPGDTYRITYDIAPAGNEATTLFVRSKGYYTEWVRGEWVRTVPGRYRFDLFHVDATMKELSAMWLRDKTAMESQFFRNRIPVVEGL